MDIKKYCIVCGTENFSRSPKFCCDKCRQHYYYQKNKKNISEYKKEYYTENKDSYQRRQQEHKEERKLYMREYMKKYRKENKNG